MKKMMSLGCVVAASAAFAAIEPVSPVGGAEIAVVPAAQKKVMSLPTLAERQKLFSEDRKNGKVIRHDPFWRKAVPFEIRFRATEGEKGPWKILIGKQPDLSDARVWYLSKSHVDKATGREDKAAEASAEEKLTIPRANLEVATKYYWKVVCRGRCGWGCGPKHGCKDCKKLTESPVSSFVTEDFAPRWIEIEGRVANIRDFGGRIGLGGKRVRQGMIYRGQGLNDNSATGDEQGRNRLTVEDVKYLKGTLGIKTDLDLRGIGETADLVSSPLGNDVKFILHSSACYAGVFTKDGMKTMAKNFRVFCDPANYPVYFHCIGGADRTGSLAYVMNGVLGVSRQEMETDWESTFYPRIPDDNPDPKHWCRESHFNNGISKYGDDGMSWTDRVVLYLKDCGITDAEIAKFREIMLAK